MAFRIYSALTTDDNRSVPDQGCIPCVPWHLLFQNFCHVNLFSERVYYLDNFPAFIRLIITWFAIYDFVIYTFIFAIGPTQICSHILYRNWNYTLKIFGELTWDRKRIRRLFVPFLTTTSLTCWMSADPFNLFILNVNIKTGMLQDRTLVSISLF